MQVDDVFVRSNRTSEEQRLLDMRKAGIKVDKEAEAALAKANKTGANSPTPEEDGGRFDRLIQVRVHAADWAESTGRFAPSCPCAPLASIAPRKPHPSSSLPRAAPVLLSRLYCDLTSRSLVRSHLAIPRPISSDPSSDVSADVSSSLQHEFVGALLRLAVMRGALLSTSGFKRQSLALCLDEIVKEHLIPFSVAKDDTVSELLQQRNVQWVLDKWRDKMAHPFSVYATADESDAVDERGRIKKGAGARMQLMNLIEMLTLFREASIIDDGHCTVRAQAALSLSLSHAARRPLRQPCFTSRAPARAHCSASRVAAGSYGHFILRAGQHGRRDLRDRRGAARRRRRQRGRAQP